MRKMKKWMLVLVALFVSASAFSQTCLDDVWQCLRNSLWNLAWHQIQTTLKFG